MRKKLLIVLIIMNILSAASSAAALSISIESLSAPEGGTVVYPLIISNAENLGAVQVRLSFNPKVIRITSASNSDFGNFVPNTDTNSAGYIAIGAFDLSESGLNGNVKLADLTIQVVGTPGASTKIELDFSAWDNDGNKITEYNIIDGSLQVTKKQEGVAAMPVIINSTPISTETPKMPEVTVTGTLEEKKPLQSNTNTATEDGEPLSTKKTPGFEFVLAGAALGVAYLWYRRR